jgi:hypothetical protein
MTKPYNRIADSVSVRISPADGRNGIRWEIDHGEKIYRINYLDNRYVRDFRGYKCPEKARKESLVGYGTQQHNPEFSGPFSESRSKVKFHEPIESREPIESPHLEGSGANKLKKIMKLKKFKDMVKSIEGPIEDISNDLSKNAYTNKVKDIMIEHKNLIQMIGVEVGIPAASLAITSAIGNPELAPVMSKVVQGMVKSAIKHSEKSGGARERSEKQLANDQRMREKGLRSKTRPSVKSSSKLGSPSPSSSTIDIGELEPKVKVTKTNTKTNCKKTVTTGGRCQSDKMKRRNMLVKKLMKEKNMSMIQASSHVKKEGLSY